MDDMAAPCLAGAGDFSPALVETAEGRKPLKEMRAMMAYLQKEIIDGVAEHK